MSLPQSQSSFTNNATDSNPATWEAIVELRAVVNSSQYIPLELLPEDVRQWHPFEGERVPPGCVAGHGVFSEDLHLGLVRERMSLAEEKAAQTGLPYRFNTGNGCIELDPNVAPKAKAATSTGSRVSKRARSPSFSPPRLSSSRQLASQARRPNESEMIFGSSTRRLASPPHRYGRADCLYPSQENMRRMLRLGSPARSPAPGVPDFGLELSRPGERPVSPRPLPRSSGRWRRHRVDYIGKPPVPKFPGTT